MNEVDPKRLAALSLREQAEVALRLPARERLELLLHAPQPMRLVRTLPDSELYFTVRDIGPYDALPLLALASADQLIHLIDLESWRGDRFDADRAGAWVALILESGEPTIVRFLRSADEEFLALLFHLWARVREIEDEDSPPSRSPRPPDGDAEEGWLTPDGQHRFFPTIPEHAPAIQRIADVLLRDDPNRYARVLRLAQWELPSELEESSLRWRVSRLEERGFPDLESALSVYAPPDGLPVSRVEIAAAPDGALTAPRSALRAHAPQVVAWIEALPPEVFERVLFQMASVANKILVAERADAGDPAAHRAAMESAVAYVGIALAARAVTQDAQAIRLFEEFPVLELFREGYARATVLQAEARRLVREGWPRLHPRAIEMLDAPLRRVVAACLARRPQFQSLAELEAARHALELAALLGNVVSATLGWDLTAQMDAGPPTLGALWLTSLARHATTGELGAGPIPAERADAFRARIGDARAREVVADAFIGLLEQAGAHRLRGYTIEAVAALARGDSSVALVENK